MADDVNTNSGEDENKVISSSPTYVYPVKSLFSGLRSTQKRRDSESNKQAATQLQVNINNASEVVDDMANNITAPPYQLMSSAPVSTIVRADSTLSNNERSITSASPENYSEKVILRERLLQGEDIETFYQSTVASTSIIQFNDNNALPPGDSLLSPFNLSQTGIVRLAPISSDEERLGESNSASHASDSILDFPSNTVSLRRSDKVSLRSANTSASKDSNKSCEPLVTFRYNHMQDENGYHVIVGREGELTRCEDEPIHAPGAVQGFGVLIAVEDDLENGNLRVRQVSENSQELLGLSARYLFSLDCFTQVLPDTQADILWDNIQYMYDSEADSTDDSEAWEGPQVFLLSGWGEPGSNPMTDEEEMEADDMRDNRRFWTCWCAAHRPPHSKNADDNNSINTSSIRSIIILEFELERDLYNPLYPASDPAMMETSSFSDSEPTPLRHNFKISGPLTPASEMRTSSNSQQAESLPTPTSPKTLDFAMEKHAIAMEPINIAELFLSTETGLTGDDNWYPSSEAVFDSTISHSKPLKALERLRRVDRTLGSGPSSRSSRNPTDRSRGRAQAKRGGTRSGAATLDIFSVLSQINDQLSLTQDLDSFLNIVVGVIKDLTQFHSVLVYQFDEQWNGQVVAELVEWRQTQDLYKGLHFPAADIPAQARDLYKINKVRLLYDRSQSTARLVVRDKSDLERPLNMTHSYLRAMSPIHIQYLTNMGVRSSMSISVVSFGALWGLISCHSYGSTGMRVSFPVRQMLRLLSDSISRNVERLSYAQRLRTRKLISTLPAESHPTGYIVSNVDDLLGLFDADFGILVIGEGAKIFGPNNHGQEVLIIAEYLRLKQFTLLQVSQSIRTDFPDLQLPSNLDVIAGLLYVPLSGEGKDFIAFLRRGQLRDVHWAGKPYKDEEGHSSLEPRKSFKAWSERIAGRSRAWIDEQMETAGVLALVYGKFIEVWRQKESAIQSTLFTNILLSNASHEVRTPLNHIINYLEMALNGPLDFETRENLNRSHLASKSLLFTINDLLDLTKLESGKETSFSEPFDLHVAVEEAVRLYKVEAERRNLHFQLDITTVPRMVVGDSRKIQTVVANLTANAVKYTHEGTITVSCHEYKEPLGLRGDEQIALEITVGDTGCGIESTKLESMFREFEQVEHSTAKDGNLPGLGLGLAVVARIVEQLGGQLRVDSKPNEGSRFSFLIPFTLYDENAKMLRASRSSSSLSRRPLPRNGSGGSSEIEDIVEALSTNPLSPNIYSARREIMANQNLSRFSVSTPKDGKFDIPDSAYPLRSIKMESSYDLEPSALSTLFVQSQPNGAITSSSVPVSLMSESRLRILIVEDDLINKAILHKRLTIDGHDVINTGNGQECVKLLETDQDFDCILMDIQMPILNGFDATSCFRSFEIPFSNLPRNGYVRPSKILNGRIPIFAVSASLQEKQRAMMVEFGMDGWILKPIDFKRLKKILEGIHDPSRRDIYKPGCNWEAGGWLNAPLTSARKLSWEEL